MLKIALQFFVWKISISTQSAALSLRLSTARLVLLLHLRLYFFCPQRLISCTAIARISSENATPNLEEICCSCAAMLRYTHPSPLFWNVPKLLRFSGKYGQLCTRFNRPQTDFVHCRFRVLYRGKSAIVLNKKQKGLVYIHPRFYPSS